MVSRVSYRVDEKDRVRDHSPERFNERIDREIKESIAYYRNASQMEISRRIEELEQEWDMERVLETNASILALTGLVLSVLHNRRWLILPFIVAAFLFQHAVQGWCPPLPVFRAFGVRTRKEIDREMYALKAIRGDFASLAS